MTKRKKMVFWAGTGILLLLALLIGPLDIFTSGYFGEGTEVSEIYPEDLYTTVDLGQTCFEQEFSPIRNHFLGFEFCFVNKPEDAVGMLYIEIWDGNGRRIDEITVDFSELSEYVSWHKIPVNVKLKCGHHYTLRLWAEECEVSPRMWLVDDDYLTGENLMDAGILMHYIYTKSAFSGQEKTLLLLFLLSAWLFLADWSMEKGRSLNRKAAVYIVLTVTLAWNYMYNSMDTQNDSFTDFQRDSEMLVRDVIHADQDNAPLSVYGLGRYMNAMSEYNRQTLGTDSVWDRGYSRKGPDIYLENNRYIARAAAVGNWIEFANGERFQIVDLGDSGSYTWVRVHLSANKELRFSRYGDLSEVLFLSPEGELYEKGEIEEYKSQFGLQGKVFRHIARWIGYDDIISNLHLVCALFTAIVLSAIVWMLYKKYNIFFAACFYLTFWLSPWVVNFARNLYWVEFTWFLPMAAGLFCSLKIESRICRIISYIAAFVTIAGKCLCGYEYISTVMMGMITFLTADFAMALSRRDKKMQKRLLVTIFIMGLAALVGFIAAICCHAVLRGDGDLWQGIQDIVEQDAVRRINGADWDESGAMDWAVYRLSAWSVCRKYFHFSTQVITGLGGNLFPLLCIAPVAIFIYDGRQGKLKKECLALYVVFFLTSVSWHVLAKAHSAIHVHMNYVLWYFGYVQICLYVIGEKIGGFFMRQNGGK